jgi:glycerol-3-phosphate responsive antiterminator
MVMKNLLKGEKDKLTMINSIFFIDHLQYRHSDHFIENKKHTE